MKIKVNSLFTVYCLLYSFFQISFAHQSFQEVIVSIVQRNVYLLSVRDTAYRVHQDKVSICTHFCAISGRAQAFHYLISRFLIVVARQIAVQFVKGRSRTCCSRSITRFIRDVRSIVIPVRNEVFRQILIGKDEIIDFLCLVEVLFVFGITITGSISVEAQACPRAQDDSSAYPCAVCLLRTSPVSGS